jgi:endonuclease/exonuclease/phosphatase family metal-dependent hydrolase
MRYSILFFLVTSLAAGIDRAESREAYSANPGGPDAQDSCSVAGGSGAPPLRVMTLNVAHGRSDGPNQLFLDRTDFEGNLDAVSDLLRASSADIVALQEVDGPSRWSGRFDHASVLARDASYPWHYRADHARSWLYRYGTAVLSRLPVGASHSHRFEPTLPTPRKGLVVSEIRLPHAAGEDMPVDVVSVHFDYFSERAKRRQLAELVDLLDGRGNPTILLGDFNSTWDETDSLIRELVDRTGLRAYEPESKELATHGDARIDWILISDEFRFEDYRVLPAVVSDHQPVVADIAFNTGRPVPDECGVGGDAGRGVAMSQ